MTTERGRSQAVINTETALKLNSIEQKIIGIETGLSDLRKYLKGNGNDEEKSLSSRVYRAENELASLREDIKEINDYLKAEKELKMQIDKEQREFKNRIILSALGVITANLGLIFTVLAKIQEIAKILDVIK